METPSQHAALFTHIGTPGHSHTIHTCTLSLQMHTYKEAHLHTSQRHAATYSHTLSEPTDLLIGSESRKGAMFSSEFGPRGWRQCWSQGDSLGSPFFSYFFPFSLSLEGSSQPGRCRSQAPWPPSPAGAPAQPAPRQELLSVPIARRPPPGSGV